MKFYVKYLLLFIFLVFVSCSPKKNTWMSRNYQDFATRYNVKFNSSKSFNEAKLLFIVASKDDFSDVITLYPIVNKETGSTIASQMDITIEKCRKIIRQHSIKSKPLKKPLGMSDAEYRVFRNQEEFNPQVPIAWVQLGKAQYYKADFVDAISAFNYAIKHYPEYNKTIYEAKLWKVRTYTDIGWLNEAESAISIIKENDVPYSLKNLFFAFKANLLLAQKQHKEAIPYLKLAIETTKDRYEKSRFSFVLAQIYEKTGELQLAQQYYNTAKGKAINYEMIFNSDMRSLQMEKNLKKSLKGLKRMLKSSNNTKYLDQIYFTIGNKYLDAGNEPKAIENYKLAMEKSSRNGIEKALVALKLAGLYYNDRKYIEAGQYYDSVLLYMPNTHGEYMQVEKKSQMLGELSQNYKIYQLQDSLLRLSDMPERDREKIVAKIIADLVIAEEKALKDSADRAAMAVAKANDVAAFDPSMSQTIGGNEWYFYNQSSINQGKKEFTKKWGNRPLEDNWNRLAKVIQPVTGIETQQSENKKDTTSDETNKAKIDRYSPQYYLRQIPKTEQDKQQAKNEIATALYNIGNIFNAKIGDIIKADETYIEFQQRFPKEERIPEIYFIEYQINGKLDDTQKQNSYRDKLLEEYPKSKYALMLSIPNYAENMRKMLLMEDSLYKKTYEAYLKGNYNDVKQSYTKMQKEFPLSNVLPKFALLNALSVAKTDEKKMFEMELDSLIAKYPNSDVTPICKDMLSLLRQGMTQQTTTLAVSSLNERRSQETKENIENIKKEINNFTINIAEQQNIIFIPKRDDKKMINNMIYDIAAYNFNKFMVKDFDIDIKKIGSKQIIVISGLESLEEGDWYKKLIFSDNEFAAKNVLSDFNIFVISDSNLSQINTQNSLEEYIKFSGMIKH